MSKERGIYEKLPGSGIWWIRYSLNGKIVREKAGTKTNAQLLLTKKRASILAGEVMPSKILFSEHLDDALIHARQTNNPKVDYGFELKMERIKADLELAEKKGLISSEHLDDALIHARQTNNPKVAYDFELKVERIKADLELAEKKGLISKK